MREMKLKLSPSTVDTNSPAPAGVICRPVLSSVSLTEPLPKRTSLRPLIQRQLMPSCSSRVMFTSTIVASTSIIWGGTSSDAISSSYIGRRSTTSRTTTALERVSASMRAAPT